MMDHMGGYPDVGYDGMRGYGHRDQGFLSKLFGGRPRDDWGGGHQMDMGYDPRHHMPQDFGPRDYPGMGYEPRGRARDFSPGRAWMASRGRHLNGDFDEYEEDLMQPRRRDPRDDLDLMVSTRDPMGGMARRDPVDIMLARDSGRRGLRSEPELPPRRDRVERDNANMGWSDNRANRGPFNIPRQKAEVKVDLPKYKFNSPQHQFHVKHKFDAYEMEKGRNNRKREDEILEELENERRGGRRRGDGYDDDDDRRGRGRERERRRDSRRRDDDFDDDDNPYHHLPAHIPKDDYDNALRRNLHAWSQWRTGLNDRGVRDPRMDSLRNRIEYQRDPDDHGFRLNDPEVLMNYGSGHQSPLTKEAYFKYGLPRVRSEGAGEDVRRLHEGRRY